MKRMRCQGGFTARSALLGLLGLVLATCVSSTAIAAAARSADPGLADLIALHAGEATPSSAAGGFRLVADHPLTGAPTRFDYQVVDIQVHRLYVAHLGDSLVTVFDTQAQQVLADIPNVDDVHGLVLAPDLGRVYASATGANQVAVIDTATLAIVAAVPTGDYPDGLAYDPEVGKVYVSNEHGGTDTVIDAHTNQPVATIPVGGDVGNTQYDPASQRIYVAVGATNQLVSIDPTSDQVVSHADLPGCDHAHGLSIDSDRRLAFVACDGNAKLLVVDMRSTQVTSLHDVGSDPDVLAFDPGLRRLYVAAESGIVTAFAEDDIGLRQIAQSSVSQSAHTVAVNPETHNIYLPVLDSGGRPVLREMALEP
jgi:YVTN family beta-propeller protein